MQVFIGVGAGVACEICFHLDVWDVLNGRTRETQRFHEISFIFAPQDRYADARSLPPEDREQNYVLTGFEETGKKTVLRFTRKIDTCDPRDRKITVIIT